MSVIESIIEAATDNHEPLTNLLRRCMVLAASLQNDQLRDWCRHELEGYPNRDAVPDYRVRAAQSYGLFIGPGLAMNEQPLSLAILEPEHQAAVETVRFSQGVSELTAMIEGDQGGDLSQPWNPNLTALYQRKFIEGMTLNRAWIKLPKHVIAGLLDTVRNRLLQFALELRAHTGSSDTSLSRVSSDDVDRSVVNIIMGGQNVVGSQVGGSVQQASSGSVIVGDLESLRSVLRDVGCPDHSISELEDALCADRRAGNIGSIGPQTGGWIGKATSAAWAAGKHLALAIAIEAIKNFLGV